MVFLKNFTLFTLLLLAACASQKETQPLTFSGTQTLGTLEKYFMENWKPRYFVSGHKAFNNKRYPSADEIQSELTTLLSYQKSRSEEDKKRIEWEKHICGFSIGGYRVGLNPDLDQLVLDAYFDARIWGFSLKKHFDRVRPSFLNPKLHPSIENPPHAAYPSNHSFQAHLIAEILSGLDPKNSSDYFKGAHQIALDREIAGVHYPSDSEFGKFLAKEFFSKLKGNETFLKAFKKLQKKKKLFKPTSSFYSKKDRNTCMSATTLYAETHGVWPKE